MASHSTDDTPPVLKVAAKAAIVNGNGQVLIMREAATDKDNTKVAQWGLVGGRLNPGEAFLDGLQREVLEEAGLHVKPLRPLYVGEWRPVIRGVPHQIVAIFMLCETSDTRVQLSPEHDEYQWIKPPQASQYNIMQPDCLVVDLLAEQ